MSLDISIQKTPTHFFLHLGNIAWMGLAVSSEVLKEKVQNELGIYFLHPLFSQNQIGSSCCCVVCNSRSLTIYFQDSYLYVRCPNLYMTISSHPTYGGLVLATNLFLTNHLWIPILKRRNKMVSMSSYTLYERTLKTKIYLQGMSPGFAEDAFLHGYP